MQAIERNKTPLLFSRPFKQAKGWLGFLLVFRAKCSGFFLMSQGSKPTPHCGSTRCHPSALNLFQISTASRFGKCLLLLSKAGDPSGIARPLSINTNRSLRQDFGSRWKRRDQCLFGSINQPSGSHAELPPITPLSSKYVLLQGEGVRQALFANSL